MNAQDRSGRLPVGHVAELEPLEASAVLYLRHWCDGPEAKAQVWNDFSRCLGAEPGRAALKSLERFCELCIRHGRRPLMRHSLKCRCLGADEACFANLIAAAAEGAREDALLLATLMVRPDVAPSLVMQAETLGLALKRIARAAPIPDRMLH